MKHQQLLFRHLQLGLVLPWLLWHGIQKPSLPNRHLLQKALSAAAFVLHAITVVPSLSTWCISSNENATCYLWLSLRKSWSARNNCTLNKSVLGWDIFWMFRNLEKVVKLFSKWGKVGSGSYNIHRNDSRFLLRALDTNLKNLNRSLVLS